MRELRTTHSGLLTELQHSFCQIVNDNIQLRGENGALQEENNRMRNDILSLQDALSQLNNVSAVCAILLRSLIL